MSRRGQSSDTRTRTLGDYSIGGDSRTCTVSSDSTSQPHYKFFYWLDMLVEENTEEAGTCRNNIFMVRRLRELEQRVLELNIELNIQMRNDVKSVEDNKCLRMAMVGFVIILLVIALRGMV
ncbi:hypothetical protein PIB30_079945 [Stylosanthes scabra]|uniref:Uncharacterized protein n=1 Tax=Stylosanthes scabra TaxID=79078 RepID=A0ABU6RRD5_9FABA|nr:hypothetical protein [Stylosanthes scabra]